MSSGTTNLPVDFSNRHRHLCLSCPLPECWDYRAVCPIRQVYNKRKKRNTNNEKQ